MWFSIAVGNCIVMCMFYGLWGIPENFWYQHHKMVHVFTVIWYLGRSPIFREPNPKLEKRAAHVRVEKHPVKNQKVKKWKVKKYIFWTFRFFNFSTFRNSRWNHFTFRLFEIQEETLTDKHVSCQRSKHVFFLMLFFIRCNIFFH